MGHRSAAGFETRLDDHGARPGPQADIARHDGRTRSRSYGEALARQQESLAIDRELGLVAGLALPMQGAINAQLRAHAAARPLRRPWERPTPPLRLTERTGQPASLGG